jgi:glycosyltransferase involved in cell wall biosynthesis
MHAGESANAYHLAKQLAERKCDVHVLTTDGNVGTAERGITVHPVMRGWSWRDGLTLRSFVKRCAPDAVLLMYLGRMYGGHPMITFLPTIAKRILPDVPVVTRFENVFVGVDPSRTSLFSRAVRRAIVKWAGSTDVAYGEGTLLRDSDRLILLCERHRDALTENWPAVRRKTVVIPPPPNMSMCSDTPASARRRGRHMLGLSPEHFVVAFLGYLYPPKGVDTLLHAFQRVSRERSHARLLIIGGRNDLDVAVDTAYLETIQKLSRELGIEDKVIWTGAFDPGSEMASVYLYSADVCALPFVVGAQMNNSSLSSAAAHAMPIITTKGRRLETPFRDRENVLLCPPSDPVALACAIDSVITNTELRERLGRGAAKLAQEWFSWDSCCRKLIRTFRTETGGGLASV